MPQTCRPAYEYVTAGSMLRPLVSVKVRPQMCVLSESIDEMIQNDSDNVV